MLDSLPEIPGSQAFASGLKDANQVGGLFGFRNSVASEDCEAVLKRAEVTEGGDPCEFGGKSGRWKKLIFWRGYL
jgi:hypothetical protein